MLPMRLAGRQEMLRREVVTIEERAIRLSRALWIDHARELAFIHENYVRLITEELNGCIQAERERIEMEAETIRAKNGRVFGEMGMVYVPLQLMLAAIRGEGEGS
jgi:hypothetical protein